MVLLLYLTIINNFLMEVVIVILRFLLLLQEGERMGGSARPSDTISVGILVNSIKR